MPSILIVDDEPMMCQFLSAKYKKEGFSTLTAQNGVEALNICKTSEPDIILTDMRMPVKTGPQFLEELKFFENYRPIIVCMTAYSDLSLQEAYDLGGTALFNKPFAIDDLVGATKKFFAEKEINNKINTEKVLAANQQSLLLSEISPGIVHNLNNHITFISGSSYFLKKFLEEEFAKNPDDKSVTNALKYSEKIITHLQVITKIIKSIKLLTSPNSIKMSKEYHNLLSILESTKYLLEDNLKINGISIDIKCDESLKIFCLPELLIQVFINLIKNSYESICEQNLVDRWIEVHCLENEDAIQLSFRDSGNKLSPEIQTQLMKPFFSTKGKEKGMGIGLSISKKLLEMHNGNLTYDPQSEYATFIVTLNKKEKD